jgi:hypothetical protein
MFLVNTDIKVNWILQVAEDLPLPVITDYNVTVMSPLGDSEHFRVVLEQGEGVLPENFLAPTLLAGGFASHVLTPDVEGVWHVTLSTVEGQSNYCIYEHTLVVHSADTHITKQVKLLA